MVSAQVLGPLGREEVALADALGQLGPSKTLGMVRRPVAWVY